MASLPKILRPVTRNTLQKLRRPDIYMISEIEQMKLSLNNTRNSHVETPPSSPKLLESHKCSPSKIIAVHIQRRRVGPDHKDSPSEPDPFLNRKGYKRPPLLKALTSKK